MPIRVVGHRGAAGYAPETTLESYRLAIAMGADAVEADVHRLRDGTIVAIHDANVRRTTDGRGRVADLTLAELKQLDAGSWFNRTQPEKARPEFAGLQVPTLQEIIDLVKSSGVELYIEIKEPERYPPDFESVLLSLVRENQLEKQTRFLSFSATSLRKVKQLDAGIPAIFLTSRAGGDPIQVTAEIPADEVGIRYDRIKPALVEEARKKRIGISVWTVDEENDMRWMIELGVDAITTNYPDRLLGLLGREQKCATNSTHA